eukprot:3030175-Rhodomonas_salina.1
MPVALQSLSSAALKPFSPSELETLHLLHECQGRLARWMEVFADYHVVAIEHVPGKLNVVVDAMSQHPDFAHLELLFSVTPILAAEIGDIATPTSDTFEHWQLVDKQKLDPFCKKLSGLLRGYAMAANDPRLEKLLLAEAHDTKYGGHLGVDKTYAALAEANYWLQMYAYVLCYVMTCNSCQLNKLYNKLPTGQLQPIAVPELQFLEVGLDFVGPLPVSKLGNNFLLTVTDYSSSTAQFIQCKSMPEHPISGQETANLYFKFIFCYHCLPAALGTAYHLQSQGLTEHANHKVMEGLWHYLNRLYEDWDDHLIAVEFAYNHSVQPSLGVTPFEFLYCFNPRTPLTLTAQSALPEASEFMQKLQSKIDAARNAIAQAQLWQAEEAIELCSTPEYQDYALLSTRDLALAYPTKFTPKYLGLFKILKVSPTGNTVKLELPPMMARHPVFSTHLLCPYKASPASMGCNNPLPPAPVLVQDAQAYWEIELIMAEHSCVYKRQRTVKYLVRWKGFGPSDDTWCKHPWFIN